MNDPAGFEISLVGAMVSSALGAEPLARCVSAGLQPAWFTDPACRVAAGVVLELWRKGRPIDPLTVAQAAGDEAGIDVGWLCRTVDACPTPSHVGHYLSVIQDAYLRRQSAMILREAAENMLSGDQAETTALDLLAEAQEKLCGLLTAGAIREEPIGAVAGSLVQRLQEPQKDGPRICWPLASLDNLLGPLQDEFVLLASQPSVGKTSFALQLAWHNSGQHRIAFASLESRVDKIAGRLLALVGGCRTLAMRRGEALPAEFKRAAAVVEKLNKSSLIVSDAPMDVTGLRAWAMREKTRGARLLIVDNLRHVRVRETFKTRVDQFAALSLAIKHLRDDLQIPVLALHHLSRDDRVAWSADFERDADMVLVLRRVGDEETDQAAHVEGWSDDVETTLTVSKNREGRSGSVGLVFQRVLQRFVDLEV